MRVIAGKFKGKPLKSVSGNRTRPTSDKIKESIFQIIGPFFDGGYCLDLFAGSGSLGIEAISRGKDYAVFIDNQSNAIHTIWQNIKALHIEDKSEVFRTDAFRALSALAKRDLQFDLILLDPPYAKANYEALLERINELNLLQENGLIYCEYEKTKEIPFHIGDLQLIKNQNYGKTTGISLYRKENSHG